MLAYNILGNNIQQARLRRGLTQEQVAVKLGLTQNHYGRFERGEIRPNIDRLFQICEILSVPIEDMFKGTYDPNKFDQPAPPDMTAKGIARVLGGCSEKKKAVIYQLCQAIAELEREE